MANENINLQVCTASLTVHIELDRLVSIAFKFNESESYFHVTPFFSIGSRSGILSRTSFLNSY